MSIFFAYPDFSYLVYQYQKRNVVYCNAVKVDAEGRKASDIYQLDTSHIGFSASNKLYSVISSEDKSKILVSKVNSRVRTRYLITTILYDKALAELKRSRLALQMEERDDYVGNFAIDNDGDLVFTKFARNSNDNIITVSGVEG